MSLIIGHRGARGLAPENTLASLREALKHGVHEIEVDIRVTKDGLCVLNHNRFLRSDAGGRIWNMRIGRHTYQELLRHQPSLPALADAIRLVNRRVPLVLEVKPGVPVTPVIATLKEFLAQGWKPEHFLVASFSQRALRDIHAALPEITLVINERFSSVRATRRAKEVGTKRVALSHHNLWWAVISDMQRRGWVVTAFSLNNPRKGARWIKRGLYGIITDYPDRFPRDEKHLK